MLSPTHLPTRSPKPTSQEGYSPAHPFMKVEGPPPPAPPFPGDVLEEEDEGECPEQASPPSPAENKTVQRTLADARRGGVS